MTTSTKPSYSRPTDPRPKWPGQHRAYYAPRPEMEFRTDCGICATVGAHRGPHHLMGVPDH